MFKANNKGAYIRPFPHVYAFVCKGCFFSDLTYLPHVSSEKIGHRYRRTPPLRKDRGESVSLPVFLGEGASVSAFFQKRSSRSVDIFARLGYRFRVLVGGRK